MSSLSRRLAAVLAAALLPHMLPGNLLTVRLRGQLLGNRRAKVCIQATELMFFFLWGGMQLDPNRCLAEARDLEQRRSATSA